MRIVCISDTHGEHRKISLPKGDVLIHAGDFSNYGEVSVIQDFNEWLGEQEFKHKLIIPGNHDLIFAENPHFARNLITNAYVLIDQALSISGVKFYGSPWTPRFGKWAFMYDADRADTIWSGIPNDVDVLVTHGPPLNFHDFVHRGEHVGCPKLAENVFSKKPKLHVFGHIHEGQGISVSDGVTFINAAAANHYDVVSRPDAVFDI